MFNSFKSKASSFLRNEAGVAAVLGAILLPTLIGSAGLAVDGTRYMRAKQIIVNSADQAAIAAASVDVTLGGKSREEIASEFFRANIPTEYANIVDLKNFTFKDDGARGGAIIVNYTINATVKPLIASAIGVNTLDVQHIGRAVREIHDVEVVMALPMSGTMCSFKNTTPKPAPDMLVNVDITLDLKPDKDCTDFMAMKKGVQSFSDLMFANQTVSRFKLGFVPYNFKIRMPDTRYIPELMTRGEYSDPAFFTNLADANPLPTILPLTTNRDKINQTINDMVLNENGTAWSRTNLPTLAAALMFEPSQNYFFPGGVVPAPFTNKSVEKVFILMSDGSNIGCCFTNWQPGDFSHQYIYFHKPDNDQQLEYCQAMKDAGITIFTIIFKVRETDKGGREINNVFARCASGAYSERGVSEINPNNSLKCSSKQNCYNVSNANELVKAYKDIAQNFYISRTSK